MIPEGRQSPIGSPDFTAGRPNSGKGRPHLPAVKRVRGMRHPAPSLHDAPDSTGRGHRLLNSKHHTPDMYPPPTCKPSDTQAATPPPREEPPLIYTARLCVSMLCPHWDSNPEHKDFKSSVSANWTMRAYPEQSGTQIFIIPRKRTRT